MLGVVLAILIALLAAGAIFPLVRRLGITDSAAVFGLSGLIGLGFLGTATFVMGLISTTIATTASLILVAVFGIAGWWSTGRRLDWKVAKPDGIGLLLALILFLAAGMTLVGALAPSTANDWDSLAYHLAVPKIWLADGSIHPIPFIHQSNFPFAVDSLFLIGLKWGGQAGAKAFVWVLGIFGIFSIFGVARARYGLSAGWWAAVLFATVPIVLWQMGTAYIDVPHGLYAGLGLAFAASQLESQSRQEAWLSGILLGLAMATKYTGLQTLAVAGLVILGASVIWRRPVQSLLIIGATAMVVGGFWYGKNVVWKENPVFPFFYSKLGGKDWDAKRSEIYTREQNSFGVGREAPPEGPLVPTRVGHSVLGLAYQPGRYVNPQQTVGGGDPLGATGVAVVVALVLGLAAGSRGKFERAAMAGVLSSLAIWFVLTQQSRYILSLTPVLALIGGGMCIRTNWRWIMMCVILLQSMVSLYLLHNRLFSLQLQVVAGKVGVDEFQAQLVPFYSPAQELNRASPAIGKVALYDEVFGFLLDVPYIWANPGHSTIIPYDTMKDGKDLVTAFHQLGITDVYFNLRAKSREDAAAIWGAFNQTPMPEEDWRRMFDNWETKYAPLLIDAKQKGLLTVEQVYGNPELPRGVHFKVAPQTN